MGNKNNILPSPTSAADSDFVLRSMRDEKPLHYTLKIQSFSSLKRALASSKHHRFESQIFNAGGYKWKLALYPNGDEKRNGSGHISLYLVSAEDDILSATSEVNVVFMFLVYDSLRDKYLAVQDGKVRRFHGMKTEWGFEKLVSVDTFNDVSNGFLVDDCCVFGVDIFVIKCDGGKGEVLSLIKKPKDYKFTWQVNNFSKLSDNTLDSNVFTVAGYRWKIQLHLKGCTNWMDDHLSLYLNFDSFEELPRGSQVYVEYEMAVLSQCRGWPRKVTYKCWFEHGRVDKNWGSPEFMSLYSLNTDGYIRSDTVIIEVRINVVSTLKKFP